MNYTRIKFKKDERVAVISLNRPESLNSLDLDIFKEMLVALTDCEKDNTIKVIVISGEGRAFSSGGDLQYMMRKGMKAVPDEIEEMAEAAGQVALKIRAIEKPFIASLKGAVAGAGYNMALNCDFRIAADDCKFVQAFVNVGLIPDHGGIYILSKLLGVAKATELAMLGSTIDAHAAYQLGLIFKTTTIDTLNKETMDFAYKLAQKPKESLKMIKRLINYCDFQEYNKYMDKEVEYQKICAASDDCKEGINAFFEKRKPVFK